MNGEGRLLQAWLDKWEEIEEFVLDDALYLEIEQLAQLTREELLEDEPRSQACPDCGSQNITELDSLKVDHHCIEWECDDCGATWSDINYEKYL